MEGVACYIQLLNKGIFYNFKNIDRQGGVLLSWRRMEYSRMAYHMKRTVDKEYMQKIE